MAPLFFVLLAASPVFAVPEDKDLVQYRDYEYADRVIGGVPAAIEEFPFLVALLLQLKGLKRTRETFACGGTIITEHWVLTAAHCVVLGGDLKLKNPSDKPVLKYLAYVRAGSSYQNRQGIKRRVMSTVSRNQRSHDIALIKVDRPWPFNGITISPARLPRQDDPVPVGSRATIVGWGGIDLRGTDPDILMKQQAVVVSYTNCNVTWSYLSFNRFAVPDKSICTFYDPMKTPSSTFKGDSGGPVVVNGQVVGVVSAGSDSYFAPNIHTRVSAYIDWIEKIVGPLPS